MKKNSKSAPKSKPKKPAAKKSPAPKARPAAPPKRAAGAPAKGGAKKRKKPGAAPAAAPPEPAAPVAERIAPPPPPEPLISAEDSDADESEVPGEAIDGKRLALAIVYALKVTPKEGELVFTRDPRGLPLVSGHDLRRCHTAYLSDKAAFHLESSVPQADARRLAKALLGLTVSMVRVGADGAVIIRHGTGQPPMRFMLGVRAITQRWEPPSQEGREPAAGALRISAAWQAAACKWGNAIVHTWQSSDGVEWCTLTDAETGELLARAVLAEDGKDLFPEDDRQTELPGSRTAGSRFDRAVEGMRGRSAVEDAVHDLKRTLRETGTTMTVTAGGRSVTIGATAPAAEVDAEEPVVRIDGEPVADAAAEPAPEAATSGPTCVRLWVEVSAWDALGPEARSGFESVEGEGEGGAEATGFIPWERRGDFVTTEVSEGAAEALWSEAAEVRLDLHEGPEAPVRLWIAEAAWDDLTEAQRAAFAEPAKGAEVALDGRAGWVTALVRADLLPALEALASLHEVTLHLGAEPPATNRDAGVA